MRSTIYSTAGQNDYFGIPNDCHVIWVSGCGGGGGGGGANSAEGAAGGSAAPAFFRVPLSVTPGKCLGIYVATAGLGGASGAAGQSVNNEGYKRISYVVGSAILSPLVSGYILQMFCLGFGEQGMQSHGGGSGMPDMYHPTASGANNRMFAVNVDTADWSYGQKTCPAFLMGAIVGGDCSRTPPSNPYYYGVPGSSTFNGNGLGTEYASDPTYSSGGAGGGSIFGKGGAGGVYSGGIGNGGNATGYGSGGGGGSGGPGPYGAGGNGASGIVVIEY